MESVITIKNKDTDEGEESRPNEMKIFFIFVCPYMYKVRIRLISNFCKTDDRIPIRKLDEKRIFQLF